MTHLDLKDFGAAEGLDVLQHLETDRHHTAGTRNVRGVNICKVVVISRSVVCYGV